MRDGNANIRKTGSNCWPLLATPVTAVKAVVDEESDTGQYSVRDFNFSEITP